MPNNLLRKYRREKDLSQEKLALLARTTRQTINAIERGRTKRPNDILMLSIAKALEVPVENIFFTPLVKHVLQK